MTQLVQTAGNKKNYPTRVSVMCNVYISLYYTLHDMFSDMCVSKLLSVPPYSAVEEVGALFSDMTSRALHTRNLRGKLTLTSHLHTQTEF